MKLDVSGRVRNDLQENEIVAALESDGWSDDGFVILSAAEEDYVQIGGGVLEYRQGGRHFRAEALPASRAATVKVFIGFLRGDRSWRKAVEWRDVTEEVDRGPVRSGRMGIAVLAFIGIIALAFVAWKLLA